MTSGTEITAIRQAILEGAPADEIGALPLPGGYRGAVVRADRAHARIVSCDWSAVRAARPTSRRLPR